MPSQTKLKAGTILDILQKLYPDVKVGFHYRDPFKILIVTMLSAQSTDRQTGPAAEFLFQAYDTPEKLSEASLNDIETRIKSVGIYKNKAKHVRKTSAILLDQFAGKVPDTMEGLLTLPGVGRKTANIVLSKAFNLNVGIAVDTHVYRLAHRLGLASKKARDRVEEELVSLFPSSRYMDINSLLIHHGRVVCKARKPLCLECVLSGLCKYFIKTSL
ncbi:MAG: endonuclease III [Candidatus Thermoplasmatota archaeon]|nr:endonuclease III [Candidatus Thermoplasmatota archaeon]MDP7264976.1 endonuclease III [Candidatus Thermoplasmatota archaeon]